MNEKKERKEKKNIVFSLPGSLTISVTLFFFFLFFSFFFLLSSE